VLDREYPIRTLSSKKGTLFDVLLKLFHERLDTELNCLILLVYLCPVAMVLWVLQPEFLNCTTEKSEKTEKKNCNI
jgi:hypothetical protein